MKTKTFDCVAAKHEIQQKLREEHGQMPWEDRNRAVREIMRRDPHLCRLLPSGTDREEGGRGHGL